MLDLDDAFWRLQLLDRVELSVSAVPQFCLVIKDIVDWAWYCHHVLYLNCWAILIFVL